VRTGLKGNNLSIKKSYFENCYFEGSNLKYTNFNETILQISAEATSFDYSDYTNAEIFNSKFLGCSFTGGFFLKTKIHNCEFHEVEFTDATFINVSFESIDFSKTSMENAEFKECTFVNCILPYFEILRISSGLNDILQNNNVFFKTVRGNYLSDISQYSIEIHELLPVFFANNDFMTLANIYIFEGNHNAAFSSIVDGIKYACKLKDFKQINNLCKLAVNNNFFTSKQLQEFYQIFKNNIKIISCCGTGNRVNPEKLKISNIWKTEYDPLAKKFRSELRKNSINYRLPVVYSSEVPLIKESGFVGSMAMVPNSAGILLASYVINDVIDK